MNDEESRTEPCTLCGTPTQANYSVQAEPTGGLGFVTCWVFLCPEHAQTDKAFGASVSKERLAFPLVSGKKPPFRWVVRDEEGRLLDIYRTKKEALESTHFKGGFDGTL